MALYLLAAINLIINDEIRSNALPYDRLKNFVLIDQNIATNTAEKIKDVVVVFDNKGISCSTQGSHFKHF